MAEPILRLAGVDAPNYATPGVNPPMALNTPTPTQGMQTQVSSNAVQGALGNAQQQLSSVTSTSLQNSQRRAQEELQTQQAQAQQQLRNEQVQAQKLAQSGDTISMLAQTASNYLLNRVQVDEKRKQQALQEAQRLQELKRQADVGAASSRVNSLITDAETLRNEKGELSGYDKYGVQKVSNDVERIIQEYGLTGDDAENLRKRAQESTGAYNKKVNDTIGKRVEEQRTAVLEAEGQRIKQAAIGALTTVKYSPYGQNTNQVVGDFLAAQQKSIMENPAFDNTQKMQLIGRLYEESNSYLAGNQEAVAKVQAHRDNLEQFQKEEKVIWERVRNGELTEGQAMTMASNVAKLYGFEANDPQDDLKREEYKTKLAEVPPERQEQYNTTLESLADTQYPYRVEVINARAWQLSQPMNAGELERMRKDYKNLTPSEKLQVDTVTAIENLKKQQAKLNDQLTAGKQSLTKLTIDNKEDFIRLAQRGQVKVEDLTGIDARQEQKDQASGLLQKAASGVLSPQDEVDLRNLKQELFEQKTAEVERVAQELTNTQAQLKRFYGGNAEANAKLMEEYNKVTDQRNTFKRNRILSDTQAVQNQSFVGVPSSFPTGQSKGQNSVPTRRDLKQTQSFASINYNGRKTIVPFAAGTPGADIVSKNGEYGNDRSTHKHAGIDFPVAEGTPLYTPISGRVARVDMGYSDPNGYGNYIDIIGDDGRLYRYAHLQSGSAQVGVGDVISAGSMFAKVGNTGRSFGAHLHFEVRDPEKPFGSDGHIDPLGHLSTKQGVRFSRVSNARTSSLPPTPSNSGSVSPTVNLPRGAVLLDGNSYRWQGRIYTMDGRLTNRNITTAQPMQNDYFRRPAKLDNKPNKNLGYAALAKDGELRKALHQVATELNIPSEWLADVIAWETGGRFSADITNQIGATGLIQFIPSTYQAMGYTREQVVAMSPAQQMRTMVKKYLQDGKRINGDYRNIGELYLTVYGGAGALKEFRKNPATYDTSDKQSTFRDIIKNKLGAQVARQHYVEGITRKDRLTQATHTSFVEGCRMCQSMRASGGIQPHQPQMG